MGKMDCGPSSLIIDISYLYKIIKTVYYFNFLCEIRKYLLKEGIVLAGDRQPIVYCNILTERFSLLYFAELRIFYEFIKTTNIISIPCNIYRYVVVIQEVHYRKSRVTSLPNNKTNVWVLVWFVYFRKIERIDN